MNKIEALEYIKKIWNEKNIKLKDKIEKISNVFYSIGLDLASTAAFIKATPSEFNALLSLSELDEEIITRISDINPPKTTWMMLADASEDEIQEAIKVLEKENKNKANQNSHFTFSELVYKSMLEIAGPTISQKMNFLTASEIKYVREKGEQYDKLTSKEIGFLKSLALRKGKGSSFTDKQINWLISILDKLINANVISRYSMDDDQELCDKILDYLGK